MQQMLADNINNRIQNQGVFGRRKSYEEIALFDGNIKAKNQHVYYGAFRKI